ncbi:transglutaminase domain protein [Russula earlei]|uniref:Transglutaminase domain protein n=1 Tax=Russula earlei TaxID=71964 RepID=A0ACC0TWT6_9AGAM|nr:transglutaminase domain protein [Russula earlei]
MAQDYKVSLIPDSLTQNADIVQRMEEIHVIIKDIDKAVVKRKYAVTILNEAGEGYARYGNAYDKFRSLSDIAGHMYDAEGKLLKSIRKKDIADITDNDGESLVSDGRVKLYAFYNKSYPYTVEFEDEQDYNGIYSLPEWTPIAHARYAAQQSKFIVETPANYHLRYKQFNYPDQPQIINAKDNITYTWEVKNKKAYQKEPYMPKREDIITAVCIAPSEFAYGGYKGDMSTWKGFGKFALALNAGRDVLPDNIKQEIHKLTDGLSSQQEKVKVLYEYLQHNSRYISIQLGIGGFQPLEAKFVAEKKYGDCKALSNYMVSLLKEAGVKANYVIVKSGEGENGVWKDFPANNFDHIIACVPEAKDTIWLECTNQDMSMGYMGNFTGNRQAVMITDSGGVIVNTPVYTSKDNVAVRRVKATLDETGTLIARSNTHFTGIQQEETFGLLHGATPEERTKYLNNTLNLSTYKVDKSEYKETKGIIPAMDEYLQITSPNYASITGKRLFVVPNLFERMPKLPTDKSRQFDIVYSNAYLNIDSIEIQIPVGFTVEAMPKDIVLDNKFGRYSIHYKVNNNQVTLVRSIERNTARFPASDYTDFVKFYDEMYKGDRARIVLVKADK